MNFSKTVIFCCAVMCWNLAALADKEEASEEMLEDQDLKRDNETSSAEAGPPDSHEAMNNRDASPKIREKRSYEFLMGLINNNSRFEVTRVDPSAVTEKPKISNENKLAASELLLELMVRIASHPQQWEKVHQLLQKLDRDLTTSRSIVTRLQTNSTLRSSESKEGIYVNKKKIPHGDEDTNVSIAEEETMEEVDRRKNDTSSNPVYEKELKWPTFDVKKPQSPVKFVNTTKDGDDKVLEGQKDSQAQNKSTKVTYPKNFSYHRVTGKPIYLNKTPKAYIAVSVIAPKPSSENTKDEVTLENELHQLKPWWTRSDSFKSSTSPKSRWVIRTGEEDTAKSVEPKL